MDNFDFFTLFIVICIALSMCGKTDTYSIEKELQEIKQEIHMLNDNLTKEGSCRDHALSTEES